MTWVRISRSGRAHKINTDMTEKQVHDRVRALFRANAGVQDARIQKRLVFMGEDHLSETLQQFKQKTHLHRLLNHDDRLLSPKMSNPALLRAMAYQG